jgi:hypothetical protein
MPAVLAFQRLEEEPLDSLAQPSRGLSAESGTVGGGSRVSKAAWSRIGGMGRARSP